MAAAKGQQAVVEILLNNQANVGHTDKNGRVALDYAAATGHLAVVNLLLNRYDNAAPAQAAKRQALMFAINARHPAVVELLLQHGVPAGEDLLAAAKDPVTLDLLKVRALLNTPPQPDEDGLMHNDWLASGPACIRMLQEFGTIGQDANALPWLSSLRRGRVCEAIIIELQAAVVDLPKVWVALAGKNRVITPRQKALCCAGILAELNSPLVLKAAYSGKKLSADTEERLHRILSRQLAPLARAAEEAEQALCLRIAHLDQACI